MSSFFSLSLLAVIVAALLDIVANLPLPNRRGSGASSWVRFARHGRAAFYSLSLAVRDMDLAVAYAMWGGFGILGTSIGGWLLLGQRLKPLRMARHGVAHRHDGVEVELAQRA